MILDTSKHDAFEVALLVGHTLKAIATMDGVTYDALKNNVVDLTLDEDFTLDSIGDDLNEVLEETHSMYDMTIIAYLDSIGVPENMVQDLISHKDGFSMDSLTSIAKSFDSQFLNDEDIESSAYAFASTFGNSNIECDGIVKPKAGYKRKLVVRKGKKTWVNKRVSGVRVKLSPKQKMGLIKARLKAKSGLAKQHRARSAKARKTFGLN